MLQISFTFKSGRLPSTKLFEVVLLDCSCTRVIAD